jgi:hypothetical protein
MAINNKSGGHFLTEKSAENATRDGELPRGQRHDPRDIQASQYGRFTA